MNDLMARQEVSPLEAFGFEFFRSASYNRYSGKPASPASFVAFQDFWDRLELDAYLADGGHYRKRRFGRFLLDSKNDDLCPLPDKPFFQSRAHNPLNGGVERQFAPLEVEFSSHPILRNLIRFHAKRINCARSRPRWLVYVHQIRILATQSEIGRPTPEGLHQDGHEFVAQILIRRSGVRGAVSHIYKNPNQPIYQQMLREPMDSILLDDQRLWHMVSPLGLEQPDALGVRDMLLIDFNSPEKL